MRGVLIIKIVLQELLQYPQKAKTKIAHLNLKNVTPLPLFWYTISLLRCNMSIMNQVSCSSRTTAQPSIICDPLLLFALPDIPGILNPTVGKQQWTCCYRFVYTPTLDSSIQPSIHVSLFYCWLTFKYQHRRRYVSTTCKTQSPLTTHMNPVSMACSGAPVGRRTTSTIQKHGNNASSGIGERKTILKVSL